MTRRCDEAYASTELRSTQIPILFFLMPDGEMQMGLLADEMTVDKSTLPSNFWGVGIGLLHLEEYPGRHSEWCGDGILAGHAGGVAQDGRPARLKRLCRQKFGVRRSTRFSISLSSSEKNRSFLRQLVGENDHLPVGKGSCGEGLSLTTTK